ncbi:MAG TPA: MlaD family protein [Thermoanaerobaculia bacterium]|nr:MlaD family protein [Thermoanaerobaculia bacterium]
MKSVIKVGIFATLCLVVLGLLIWKIEDLNLFGTKGQRLDAVFRSVAGLDDKASVRVAGVKVGHVDGVGLQDNQARISLSLDKPLPLTVGTTARIANLGLLGEKYVEIIPGPPGAPPLPPNTVLQGTTPPSIDEALAKINDIGSSIQSVTGQLSGGNFGGNLNDLIHDIQLTSAELRALIAENRANVAATIRNYEDVGATLKTELPRLSQQTSRAIDQIQAILEENRGNVSGTTANLKELTTKLQTSADNLNKISGKIASGEGTIGKLVNDEKAYNDVISTLDSIKGGVDTLSGTLGAINKFKIDLDLQGYYLANAGRDKVSGESQNSLTSFNVEIDPQDKKHLYRLGLVSSPEGKLRDKTQTFIITGPDGIPQTTTLHTLTQEQSYTATGLFGYKAPYDARLWAGIIEGSGGAQVEYPLPVLNRKLLLSFEAFGFNRPDNQSPHLRLTGRYQFHPNLYLLAGYDDPLEHHAFFLGGGIRWSDENIKYLLGSLGGLAGR